MNSGIRDLCTSNEVPSLGSSRPDITTRLKHERGELEKRLEKINHALGLLEENPKMQELLDALGRTYL